MKARSQKSRLVLSLVMLMGVAASVPATNAIAQSVQFVSLFSGVVDAASETDLAERVSGSTVEQSVPEAFAQEVFSMEGEREVCCLPEQDLIGFYRDEGAASTFDAIRSALEEKEWSYTESGIETCGTFSKETGELRWLFVSCTELAGQTSVVMQYASSGAENT